MLKKELINNFPGYEVSLTVRKAQVIMTISCFLAYGHTAYIEDYKKKHEDLLDWGLMERMLLYFQTDSL